MKQKLLSLLVLLMTAATGAWAQDPDYDINVSFEPYYHSMETHFNCMIMNQMEPWAEIKGTLSLSVDGVSKGSFNVNGEMVDGSIAALDAGDHTYSAVFSPEGGGSFNANGSFTIDKADTYIIYYGSTSINLGVGESTELTVSLYPDGQDGLSYSSSDASVASITKKEYSYSTYIIQAKAAGTATITFSYAGNTNYDAADEDKTITVTVGPAGPTVVASGNCGTSGHESEVTWTLTDDGVMTISGTGAMANYASASDREWNTNPIKSSITSVVVEEGVTHIGNNAFWGCQYVASVSIPASVTSIGSGAFTECGKNATVLTVTFAAESKLESIGDVAFWDANLTSITIPASVTSIGEGAFYECANLATVTLNSNPFIDEYAFLDIKDGAVVTMNLTANLADGAKWMTFCSSGYNFQADANTQVFQAELSGTELTLHEIADKIVNVSEGVILKSTGNPVMTLTTTDSSDEYLYNNLTGVLNSAGRDNDGCFYVLNYKAATGVGFYKLAASKTTLEYGKAFLWYDSSSSAPLRDYFEFLQDETTGIQQTEAEVAADYGTVYDLQGRPVTNPAPGIYIVNGKKVFIK